MSIKQFRIDDKPTNMVNIHLRHYNGDCNIKFSSNNKELYIMSTDVGHVSKNQIVINGSDKREINVIVDHNGEKIECLISYLDKGILKDYESIESELERASIRENPTIHNIVKTISAGNAKDKMFDFIKNLEDMKSSWKIEIKLEEHINIKIISLGNTKGLFAIGEESKELLYNDFVFSIYPKNDLLVMPKELIENNHKYESILYVYELVKPDFIKAANSLFKVKVSNGFALKDIKKHPFKSLWYFKTPCGINFDPSKWKIGRMGLPVRVAK